MAPCGTSSIMLRTLAKSTTKVNFAAPSLVALRSKHTLPDLPYDYDALEPIISTEIMRLHHSKHHQTYVNNLNIAEEKNSEAISKNDLTTQISLQPALKFNGGGHVNHSIFWTNLAPLKEGGGEPPKGELLEAIKRDFGSLEQFIKQFNTQTTAVQGSGWGWLGYNKAKKSLQIQTTANQDVLTDLVPLLGVDVWEHAYYLQYKNARPDYLTEIWKIVNWNNVTERYNKARA
ncbi:manganese and iron superoxide dismutase [Basidiobolus meristosporus CBS 931.73]|uniref:Superoxide dismutase n=1 Tax=Basidiobolus meristosporus CBS 931.73 TaxID=1314790 RepID=A0A1Y1YKV7_9FUNG|nr:manganese and iron superoxide dismutase [Basidiobolus meristosporus CBS 931.73]|eukprot:ORX98650.1 manganese and iron superoxide dismutase [Basidiobolus meristosporus CBS 931.73]